jgi:hypothetical protein
MENPLIIGVMEFERYLKKEMLFWTETPEEVIATIKQIFN